MSAAEPFVPLADLLRAPAVRESLPPAAEPAPPVVPERAAAIREARLFCARLADALDARLARLLAAIASEILMRELRAAPVDLAALVTRIVAEHTAPPLAIRVAPIDRDALAGCDVRVIEDTALESGDAVVVFAAGEIDARLGVRLAAVLEGLQ
jgi:flagellar biosynthesis/type III secretory pathway protein FliH